MRKAAAARADEIGLQLLTLPHLAARLAGGFFRAARSQELDEAIRKALEVGGFKDIESMRELPGMTRAISRSLSKLWRAEIDFAKAAKAHARMRDLYEIDQRIRTFLPAGALTLRDLRDRALLRISHAKDILGEIEIDQRSDIVPLWRPLLTSLAREIRVIWREPATPVIWFPGEIQKRKSAAGSPKTIRVSCANPRSEVIEALRWMRELLARGVPACEIAVCAANTETWDDHFDALATDAALPMHFAHGRSALATYDGQACAALADALIQGITQRRVKRAFRYGRFSKGLKELPNDWARGIKRDAALLTVQHWQHALDRAVAQRDDVVDPRSIIMPIIELLARGAEAAAEVGELVLGNAARGLWTEALRRAPAQALLLSLQELRLPDQNEPSTSVVWCSAGHLAEAPRPYVRMLGLTARSWPRRGSEDPLLPSHIISGGMLDPTWITQEDRGKFQIIHDRAEKELAISRSRRDAQGKVLPPSSLTTQIPGPEVALKRTRIPSHAFGEGDRLLARPTEAAKLPQISSATECWRNREGRGLTAHDGLVRAEHPVVIRALEQVQSATSLKTLLRDPLGFVWRYGLRWGAPPFEDQPLSLDLRTYGELVHEILKHAVRGLEPTPGFRQAELHEVVAAVDRARALIKDSWPLEKPVPPAMLWEHTLSLAGELAIAALTLDPRITAGSQSWAEAHFGQTEPPNEANPPWRTDEPVPIPRTSFRIRGRIDRLDIRIDDKRRAAQVTDYKTGRPPEKPAILDGGRELQRVTYTLAVKHLRPDINVWSARLVYLTRDGASPFKLERIDRAIEVLGDNLNMADALLRQGIALPGKDAEEDTYELRLAHSARRRVYFGSKRGAIYEALGEKFVESWECP